MLFKGLVTTDARKGASKAKATTLGALGWVVWLVLSVGVLALAACCPGVDIESLSSWKPPLSDFLWSTRNEGEPLAWALGTIGHSFLRR